MKGLRLRKFSPIDRTWPIFEVIDDNVVVLDITKNDVGELEVGFHMEGVGRVVALADLLHVVEEARRLLEEQP